MGRPKTLVAASCTGRRGAPRASEQAADARRPGRAGSRGLPWRLRFATRTLVVALGAVTVAVSGCGKLFSDGDGQNNRNVSGIGPDGGICTKDPVVIKNVMLAPPVCNATAPCPCGTFCSSQTGGNCIADCVDDTWCAPGYVCSPFGQCLRPTDGGATDGAALALDPSCPRNTTLLDSIKTAPRACPFDDTCPFGSFCNHVTEVCDWSCKVDTDCAGMNSPGHTFVCGCLGQCAEVAAPQIRPATALPSLEVSPKQYVFERPATITTPVWGDVASRRFNLTAVAQSVTTWPPSANFTVRVAGGNGLVGPFSVNGSGPGKTFASNSNATLPPIDGVALAVGDRVLLKDVFFSGAETSLGIYTVTSLGSASTRWTLTRAADYDTASPSEVRVGASVLATAGTTNGNRTFVLTSFTGAVDVGLQTYTSADFTVRLATTVALNVTPSGPAGVGKTLTVVGNGALTVDGVLMAQNDRILLKNQVDAGFASSDGIYTLIQQGTASLPAILTRATDYDTASPSEVRAGVNVRATAGTANANKTFILTAFGGAVDVAPQKYVAAVAGTTIIGPTITIQANPGPGLMVQCPPATTLSASPCSMSIDPSTFKLVKDAYRSTPVAITVGPSSGAPTATSWDLRLESNDAGNMPRAINLRYADAVSPTVVAPSFQPVGTLDPAFTGVGSVQFATPTGVPMTIPVKARTFNGSLVLYDETRQLSPSGKIVLITQAGTDPTYVQEYLDPGQTGPTGQQQAADPALADSIDGGRVQKIISYTINQDAVTGNLTGTFKREIAADSFFIEVPNVPIPPVDTPADVTFTLAKAPTGPNVPPVVATCTTDVQCLPGLRCDLGLCSSGAPHRFISALAPWTPGALTQWWHRRMTHWGPHTMNSGSTIGYKGFYVPGSWIAASANSFVQLAPVAPISGEMRANVYDSSNALVASNVAQMAIPLLTQHDGPWNMPASQLLATCLAELAREPTPGILPTTEAYDLSTNCINQGRVDIALGDMKTFQHALQGWLQVHSFVEREGLEEALMTDGMAESGLSTVPTAPLEQILGAGESGLGMLVDVIGWGAYQGWNLSPTNTWTYLDFRSQSPQTCTSAFDCNGVAGAGGSLLMSCSAGVCTPLTLDQLPQHEQPVGIPPMILETAASYLKVMEAYLNKVGRQTYGQPADNSPSSLRATALSRFGSGMRLVLLAEQIAVGINTWAPCPGGNLNCAAILTRYNAARDEMNAARSRVVAQAEALRTGGNPFGIPEDDVPLFFGDPTGTNSRYFAASDYLIDGWAGPAVAQASATLDSARAAWIAKSQALVQDEQNQHSRSAELSQLMSKYGAPILASCGNMSAPNGTGGYTLLDSGEVIPYFAADRTRTLSNDTCFIDPSCLAPNDQREATRLGLAANFLDGSGNLLPGDPSNPTTGPTAADFFVRSETCKVSWFTGANYTAAKPFAETYPSLLVNLCPHETYVPFAPTAPPCTVAKWPADNNLYFYSLPSMPPIPVAALYGPIRRADLGTYYQHTPAGPITIGGIRFDVGPDNNVFNYIDFRTDQTVPRTPTAANTLTSSAQFTRLEDGTWPGCQNGFAKVDRDYPRPSLTVLPPACYKGSLGVAFYEVQTNNLRLQRAKDVLDTGKKNLADTFGQCTLIDLDNATLATLNTSYKSLKQDYEMASAFAGGVSAVLSPGGLASFGLGLLGQSVADEAAQIQQMEALFARTERAQDCWNNFRAQRRGMSTALTDIQIATSQVNAQVTAFRNLQDANKLNLQEGLAAWDREQKSPLGSLSHHFWVDEKVERFRKELEWARRLTFAAMRAVEYDFQQSLPFRSQIVSATTPSQLEEVMLGLKQEQAAHTINRRRPDEASIVVSLRDDVLGIADRSADPAGERNWTPAQRFSSRLWDTSYAYRDSKGNYLGQGIPFTLGPQDILLTRCGERLWRATATLQGDGLDASAPGASVLLLKRNTFQSQYCAGKAPTSTPLANSTSPTMQVGVVHTSAQLFEPGSTIDLSDANQFTAALLYPWFNIRKTDFYRTTYQDGASEELAGRGLYGDYVLLFPKQMLDDSFTLNRVEDVLLRLDYLSVDNLSQ